MCIGPTGAYGLPGYLGAAGPVGDVGATGATGIQVQSISRRVVREAGCPGKLKTHQTVNTPAD